MLQLSGDGSEGIFEVTGDNLESVQKASDIIMALVAEPEVGEIYK